MILSIFNDYNDLKSHFNDVINKLNKSSRKYEIDKYQPIKTKLVKFISIDEAE